MTCAFSANPPIVLDIRPRRALVICQEDRTHWYVIVRHYYSPPPGWPADLPRGPLRSYADALSHAQLNHRLMGLPVLMEPLGEEARPLSPKERHDLRNSYLPSHYRRIQHPHGGVQA